MDERPNSQAPTRPGDEEGLPNNHLYIDNFADRVASFPEPKYAGVKEQAGEQLRLSCVVQTVDVGHKSVRPHKKLS
ncbi:hypothetical protein GCM10028805_53970 [Spirosoma harenae]